MPAAASASRIASATADVRRLVPAPQPDPVRPEARPAPPRARRGPSPSDRRRLDDRQRRRRRRRARRRTTASASPVAPVTARSPRSMIAAFSRAMCGDRRAQPGHVVEVDVGDGRHAAVPGVGRVEPPAEPDLDEGQVDARLREPTEHDGGQQLELGRRSPCRRATRSASGSTTATSRGEVVRPRSAARRSGPARGSVTRCGLGVSPTR